MIRRKTLIPMVILAILSWVGLGFLLFAFSPNSSLSLPIPIDPKIIFFLLLFLALFLTSSLLLGNTRRGLLFAFGTVTLTLLRFFHLFHPLYIILLFAILFTIEFIFSKTNK